MRKKIIQDLDGLKGCFVAGGALTSIYTNKPINDYDIYPKSKKDMLNACQWAFDNKYWVAYISDRALTFVKGEDDVLQIMTFSTYKKANDIFKDFDFTINMAALDLDSGKEYFHKNFLKHNAQRFLKFNPKAKFPYASAMRVNKYQERGYTIGNAEYFKILLACQKVNISSWEELKNQIGGVYGDLIEIPEDGKFTMKKAISAMSKIKPQDTPPQEDITCMEDIAIMFWPQEKKVKYYDGSYKIFGEYIESYGLSKKSIEKLNSLKLIEVSDRDVHGDYLYKVVKVLPDGSYVSEHNNRFTYTVGQIVESGDPYIFCGYKGFISQYTYFNWFDIQSGKKAVLKLSYSDEDVVTPKTKRNGKKIQVKKCKVESVLSVKKVAKFTGNKINNDYGIDITSF